MCEFMYVCDCACVCVCVLAFVCACVHVRMCVCMRELAGCVFVRVFGGLHASAFFVCVFGAHMHVGVCLHSFLHNQQHYTGSANNTAAETQSAEVHH